MNSFNKLLSYLDDVFGFENKVDSSFRKVGQTFDERTNEHVVQIEYRIRTKGGGLVTKKKSGKKLMKDINNSVRKSK